MGTVETNFEAHDFIILSMLHVNHHCNWESWVLNLHNLIRIGKRILDTADVKQLTVQFQQKWKNLSLQLPLPPNAPSGRQASHPTTLDGLLNLNKIFQYTQY